MNALEIEGWLVAQVAERLRIAREAVDVRASFDSFGFASRDAVVLSGDLEILLGRELSPTLLYEYPTIAALSEHLTRVTEAPIGAASYSAPAPDSAIAIVGMACRFPGASDLAAYWQLLAKGQDLIREVPAERWDLRGVYHPNGELPGRSISRWGSFLDDIDRFDPFFFGISPGEAERMDPQQRLLLELAWECFEDAGAKTAALASTRTGVFVGVSVNEYALLQHGRRDLINGHSGTGNALSIAANRISYYFDLHGPSVAIDTACSSSLMAVHQASASLRTGECRFALAGGVNVVLSPAHSIAFTKAGVLARDGRCKVFDARADGYVRGEGGGLVALKRLSDAIADGDAIYAVIRGSAVHQDGRTNGLMAPSREAQEAVLRAAYAQAGVAPSQVQYIEAHGTGTLLGDAMEAHALGAVVGVLRGGRPCAVGSVKSNFGHLEAAAGIAGLIKVALSMKNRMLPPTLHFENPNPHVAFADLGLRVQTSLEPWADHVPTMLAGVSSFGFGGTNVHAVLEEPPARPRADDEAATAERCELIALSAHTPAALAAQARGWRDWIVENQGTVQQVSAAAARRNTLAQRAAIVTASNAELADALAACADGSEHPALVRAPTPAERLRVAFVFSGQGGQWLGMGRQLLRDEAGFRAALEACDRTLRSYVDWSLLEQITAEVADSRLSEIDVVQPTIFAIQVALARVWESWGMVPFATVGHSMGEVAAAHISGALSLDDAARVICERSRLLKRLSGRGLMAIVALSADAAARAAEGMVSIAVAASNSPLSTVVAGDSAEVTRFCADLERQGVWSSLINVDVAAHSPQTLELGPELRAALSSVDPADTTIPVVSTVTGRVHDGLLDADYWADNLTRPVRFTDAVGELIELGCRGFLEIGPHPVLASAVQQSAAERNATALVVPTLRRDENERAVMLNTLGTLFVAGAGLELTNVAQGSADCVALPPYAWQRERFWIDGAPDSQAVTADADKNGHVLLGQPLDVAGTPGHYIWQFKLNPAQVAFLQDHRVNGDAVLPAAAYIDWALAAAGHAGSVRPHVIGDLELRRALAFADRETRIVQVELVPTAEGSSTFSVHSRASGEGDASWTLHARATLTVAAVDAHIHADNVISALTSDGAEAVMPDDVYRGLAQRGVSYGPAMRALQRIWRRNGHVLARVVLPESESHEVDGFVVHPALLDAALQVLAANATAMSANNGDTFMPVACRVVRFHRRPGRAVWSHATLNPATSADAIEADIQLIDDDQDMVAEIEGLRLARVAGACRPFTMSELWRYEVQWHVGTWKSDVLPGAAVNRWLVLPDRDGVAAALCAWLRAQGQECQVMPDASVTRAQLNAFLDSDARPVRGVLQFANADCATVPQTAQYLGSVTVSLVQALTARAGEFGQPRLWLVTNNAQSVTSTDAVSLAHTPVWGLGRTVAFELPELKCTLVDLDAAGSVEQRADALLRELCVADDEDLIAVRAGRRMLARLAAIPSPRVGTARALVRDDATYLITGGLGGLGLAVATWLVAEGARNIALLGRSGPNEAARESIAALRARAANIQIVAADVASEASFADALRDVRERMPPLRGVVHAAGVLDNAALVNLDEEKLAKVMAPKVDGAWNLHCLTRDDALDWFVLFSSAVTVLGSPGQGNYAAANSFLDALAHQRRHLGLPGTSINWGPWAEMGLVAGGFRQPPATRQGVKSIAPERGLAALEETLRGDVTQVTVLPFDLRSLLELYPAAARVPFFSEVGGSDVHVSKLYARPSLPQPYVAPRTDIERRLAELWRQTLRIDKVGMHDSFFALGGDSVLAAQIVSAAHRSFGVSIDLKEAFQEFTIEHLAQRLEAALVEKISALSESEAQRLLDQT